MPRWLKITGIGCGGLLGLFILLGVVGALVGGGDTATETNSRPEQTEELEEAREEAAQARREAEAAREEATRAEEQAAQAEEARTEAETATDEDSSSTEGNDSAGDQVSREPSPEDVLALQYEHVNAGDYEAAYDLLTEQSKQLVSLGQYSTWFEDTGNYQIVDFSFPTAQVEDDTATLVADLSVTSDTAGEEQYQATQEMQLENESWRIVLRDEQVDTFAGVDPESSPEENDVDESPSEPATGAIELSGAGQEATDPFDLEPGLAIFRMTHQGQNNFIVDLLDESGQSAAPMGLVNQIGSFEGSYAQQVTAGQHVLDITADGSWNITVEQPRPDSAPETRSFEGTGKTATEFFQLTEGLHTITLTHQGDANFIVDILNRDGAAVDPMGLVNEIGAFEGSTTVTVPEDGIYLFQVEANGPWTINVE